MTPLSFCWNDRILLPRQMFSLGIWRKRISYRSGLAKMYSRKEFLFVVCGIESMNNVATCGPRTENESAYLRLFQKAIIHDEPRLQVLFDEVHYGVLLADADKVLVYPHLLHD